MQLLSRSLRRLAVAALAWQGLWLPALAQKGAAPSCPSRPIVVGLYEFGNFYRSGVGHDKDLADELARRSGCKFVSRVMQRRAIWTGMQAGTVDMTFSAAATPERQVFSWAAPYMWVKNMVVLRKDADPNVHSMTAFIASPELRLGFGRGFAAGPAYEDFVTQLRNIGRVEDVDDGDRLYAMFKAGRFQALLAPKLVYSHYLKDEIMAGAVRVEDWSNNKQHGLAHLMMSKKLFSAEDAQRWGDMLKAMNTDGTMARLLAQYVGKDEAAKMLMLAAP